MKLRVCLVILMVCFCAEAWVATIPYEETDNEGYCYTETYELGAFEKDETKLINGQCAKATCVDNRDIEVTGCGIVVASEPCVAVPEDLSKEYPKCCPTIECN